MSKKVKVNCAFCGKELERYPSFVNKSGNAFCNNKCQWGWRKQSGECIGENHHSYQGNKQVVCNQCGVQFEVSASRYNLSKTKTFYCTPQCMNNFYANSFAGRTGDKHPRFSSVKRLCDNCMKEILVPRKALKYQKHFCNKECRHEFLKNNSSSITVHCEICGKEKIVNLAYYNRHSKFYCKEHRNYHCIGEENYAWKGDIEILCEWCKRSFLIRKAQYDAHNTKRIFCSKECRYAWHAETFKGENHPNWNSVETTCVHCGTKIVRMQCEINAYEKLFCSMECRDKHTRGPNHHCWLGGSDSILNYDSEFNQALKEYIRDRDSHICQICNINENGKKLAIHHINYNKKDSSPQNLVSLCSSCHSKTNTRRDYWTQYLHKLLSKKYGYVYNRDKARRGRLIVY